jgi:hypothetical protein
MQTIKKNIERMIGVISNANCQSAHNVVSELPWEHEPVSAQVANDCNRLLGGGLDIALILTKVAFRRKGRNRWRLPVSGG